MVETVTRTRHTAHQDDVRRALEAAQRFVSAQQLHRLLALEGNRIALSTVYRQLGVLAANGKADTVSTAEGRLYRACGPGAHHHLVCESCGRAVEIDAPREDRIRAIARAHGYTVTEQVLEIFGRCAACAAARGVADDAREGV